MTKENKTGLLNEAEKSDKNITCKEHSALSILWKFKSILQSMKKKIMSIPMILVYSLLLAIFGRIYSFIRHREVS